MPLRGQCPHFLVMCCNAYSSFRHRDAEPNPLCMYTVQRGHVSLGVLETALHRRHKQFLCLFAPVDDNFTPYGNLEITKVSSKGLIFFFAPQPLATLHLTSTQDGHDDRNY